MSIPEKNSRININFSEVTKLISNGKGNYVIMTQNVRMNMFVTFVFREIKDETVQNDE